MAGTLSVDSQILAGQLDEHYPVFQLSSGDPPGHLHDQRDRVDPSVASKGDEKPWSVPKSGFCPKDPLSCYRADIKEVEAADQGLGGCFESFYDRV